MIWSFAHDVARAVPCVKHTPVARYVSEAAKEINLKEPIGFAGINRLHFLWLFFAIHWYAAGLIAPVYAIWTRLQGASIIHLLLTLIADGIPATALLVPGFYGYALLSGHRANNLNPAARNLLGIIVIAIGFLLGIAIQLGWAALLQGLFG
jgi:hypothetical protein